MSPNESNPMIVGYYVIFKDEWKSKVILYSWHQATILLEHKFENRINSILIQSQFNVELKVNQLPYLPPARTKTPPRKQIIRRAPARARVHRRESTTSIDTLSLVELLSPGKAPYPKTNQIYSPHSDTRERASVHIKSKQAALGGKKDPAGQLAPETLFAE